MKKLTDAQLQAKVKRLLKNLGNGHAAIAKSLERKKIKGDRDMGVSCPIANYLTKSGVLVSVGEDVIDIQGDGRIPTPAPVVRFINAFDEGKYPKLDINEVEDK